MHTQAGGIEWSNFKNQGVRNKGTEGTCYKVTCRAAPKPDHPRRAHPSRRRPAATRDPPPPTQETHLSRLCPVTLAPPRLWLPRATPAWQCYQRSSQMTLCMKKARVYPDGEGVPYYMLRELAFLKVRPARLRACVCL